MAKVFERIKYDQVYTYQNIALIQTVNPDFGLSILWSLLY